MLIIALTVLTCFSFWTGEVSIVLCLSFFLMITNNQEPGISTSQKNAHRKVDIN